VARIDKAIRIDMALICLESTEQVFCITALHPVHWCAGEAAAIAGGQHGSYIYAPATALDLNLVLALDVMISAGPSPPSVCLICITAMTLMR
jgi:hypothetical protein